jgi:hypothetical protein
MRHLGLPGCFEETWKLASQVGPWGVLELLGRSLLREGSERLATDPIWAALAKLDGREPRTLPGEGFAGRGDFVLPAAWLAQADVDQDNAWLWAVDAEPSNPLLVGLNPDLACWLVLVLPYIRCRLQLALGGTESEPLNLAQVLLLVRSRLYVTSSHVDLVMRLDDMSLPARLVGLDFDPGWLPDFGRVVQFHFE